MRIAGVVVAGGVVIGVGVAIGLKHWLTEAPKTVGVEETVENFRKASQRTAPVDGVYVYDTKGSESVDVLGGDTHTYPPETALTVMAEGCGLRMTWKPLDGRAESWLVCPAGGGLDVPSTTSVHSFFRQTYDTPFVCQGSWWVPPPGTTTWTSSCSNADRTATRTGHVVGIEPYTIDGASRQAIHEQAIDDLSRDSVGTVTTELWIDQATGLMLREHIVTDSHNDSVIGAVYFKEDLDLTLRSLVPQR